MEPAQSGAVVDLIVFGLVVVGFGLLFWRVVVGRKRLSISTKVLGTIIYEEFQNADGKAAVEEMVYTKDSWTQEEKDGDPEVSGQDPARDGRIHGAEQ